MMSMFHDIFSLHSYGRGRVVWGGGGVGVWYRVLVLTQLTPDYNYKQGGFMPSKWSWYFSLCLPSNDWILVSFHSAESQMSFVHFKALIGLLGITSLILLTAIVVIMIKRRQRYNTCIWFTSRTQKSQDGNETNSKLMTTELWIVIYPFADILDVFRKFLLKRPI